MSSGIDSLSFEALAAWDPKGTVVAFFGTEALLHAAVHSAVSGSLAAVRPELRQWNAVIVDAAADKLEATLKILHEKKVWGLVFSAPLKGAALKVLSPTIVGQSDEEAASFLSTAGSADATAERVGAVNIALWRPTGYWGLSTDGEALVWALGDAFQLDLRNKNVFVIGAGAFGRATAVEALSRGCRELWIGDRTQDNAWNAIDQIVPSFNMRARIHSFNLLKPSAKMPRSGVIINTLPASVRQSDTAALAFDKFDHSSLYFDSSLRETSALQSAKALRMPSADARRLFAHQVCRHIEALVGARPDFEMALWATSEALSQVI